MNTGRVLHENFYHGNMSEERVRRAVEYMDKLVSAVLGDLDAGVI